MAKRRAPRPGMAKPPSIEIPCDVLDCQSKTTHGRLRSDGWYHIRAESRYGTLTVILCPKHIRRHPSDDILAEAIALGIEQVTKENA
jgi:hypothetical protein